MPITLTNNIRDLITFHALEIHPNECCGFLYGYDREDGIREIREAIPVINSRDGNQRNRFEIHPEDYMQAEKYSKENDISFLGIYHSHPDSPAIASEYDRSHAFPFFSYIIVSITKDKMLDIRSWILDDEFQFEEEKISFQGQEQ